MSRFFDDFETQLRDAAQREVAGRAASKPRSWWQRPRAWALLAVGVAGLATPALARVTGLWNPGVSPGPPARTVTAAPGFSELAGFSCTSHRRSSPTSITNVSPSARLTSILGVLRTPYTNEDRLPGLFKRHGRSLAGVNPKAIRFVGTTDGTRYFVVANQGMREPPIPARCLKGLTTAERRRVLAAQPRTGQPQICLLSSTGSGACGAGPDDLLRRGTALSSGDSANHSRVAALVPDGVTAVTITYGRSRRTFVVHNNFYAYSVAVAAERRPNRVVWHLANGSTREVQ